MKIYHYHPDYKYFLSEGNANPSPLEPGVYAIPAHATDIEPPECSLGHIQVFNGSSWIIVEDKRGRYYCKETLECHNIEDPCACCDHLTSHRPPFEYRNDNQIIKWNNGWNIETLDSPPEPEPIEYPEDLIHLNNMSPQEKLSMIGLTIEDLKNLLGMTS